MHCGGTGRMADDPPKRGGFEIAAHGISEDSGVRAGLPLPGEARRDKGHGLWEILR
jgi:hypothetical protein